MKAATVAILIASLSLPAGLAAKGLADHQQQPANTYQAAVTALPFVETNVHKTSRLPLEPQQSAPHDEQSAIGADANSEWALDCYDAYGADGGAANEASLQACLKG